MLLLGLTAYMTMRGLLALVRVNAIETSNIDLAAADIANQGIDTLIGAATGIDNGRVITWIVAIVLGLGPIIYAFASKTFRSSFDNILAGLVIGLIIPAGWYVTAVIGFDDFDPVRF